MAVCQAYLLEKKKIECIATQAKQEGNSAGFCLLHFWLEGIWHQFSSGWLPSQPSIEPGTHPWGSKSAKCTAAASKTNMWLRGRWGQIKFHVKEEEFPSHPITTNKYKQMSPKNLGIFHDFPWITVNHVNPGPIHTQIAHRVGTKELSPFVGHRPIAINRVHYVGV